MATTQPFPPGMSRLERLPDELKLKVGYYLMAPAREHHVPAETHPYGSIRNILPRLFQECFSRNYWETSSNVRDIYVDTLYSDSVLALASTSTRLYNVFLLEHSKKYGVQNTLNRCIELGHLNLVKGAVECGADINKQGAKVQWGFSALQLAVKSEQLPVILYLLRCGADKADELVMDVLCGGDYHVKYDCEGVLGRNRILIRHCRCDLLLALMNATLGRDQASNTNQLGPRLAREALEALAPNGRHLWYILRRYMEGDWDCSCGKENDGECPMSLISLLRRYGAKWMPCGPFEDDTHQDDDPWYYSNHNYDDWEFAYGRRYNRPRGFADLRRFLPSPPRIEGPVQVKPSVAGAMHGRLLASTAYRRDHCVPFLVAMLEHGVTAEQGDLTDAMDLASEPDTKQLSIAIVVALLRGGTNPNEPGVLQTAMRLACMYATKDAAVAFVTLLLEHGADPSVEEMQDEIQGAAEKWWIQSTWQSSGVFCRIMGLLVDGGLDEHIAWEILAVLGLDHDFLAKVEGDGPAMV